MGRWLGKSRIPIGTMPDLPEGWTDDMTVALPAHRTVTEVVNFVIEYARRRQTEVELELALASEFGLSADDAAVVSDRVYGGVVRAATHKPSNRPDREKDPFAWTSFGRATDDPSIIATMYPERARPPEPPWWRRLLRT
jgi:hypothetical protein